MLSTRSRNLDARKESIASNMFGTFKPTLALSEINNNIITIDKEYPADRSCFIERNPFGRAINPMATRSPKRSKNYR